MLATFTSFTGAAGAMFTTFTAFTTLAAFTRTTRTTRAATVAGPAMRRRPGGPHPLSAHPVDDAVELFDDSIEAAGRIVACRGPLGNRSLLGSSREMNPASHGPEHHHTPGHDQPFQETIHRMFSQSIAVLPSFTGRFRGGIAVNSMLLET
jgi:hypothetical protein